MAISFLMNTLKNFRILKKQVRFPGPELALCINHDTYGLLRASHSRTPKNIRNPPNQATFSCFLVSQTPVVSCKHETQVIWTPFV